MTKHKNALAFLIGAVLGAVVFIIIFGADIISPSNVRWIFAAPDDTTQHHLGWLFYRRTPWTFPIGLTEGITSEGAVSCMFTDSLPLFAVFFKLLSPILPETFQYFGLWGVICFALNGGFGAALLSRIKPNLIFTSVGSLFYSAFLPSIARITHHNSLGAIWLVLIAMILTYDYKKEYRHKFTSTALWCLTGCLAVLIHVYFIPMIYSVMIGYVILTVFRQKKLKKAILTFGCTSVSVVFVMWVIGAFYGHGSYADGGLGVYSSNINTFFNSMGRSKFLIPLNSFDGQAEGFGYLGLGMIICGFLAFIVLLSDIEKREGGLMKNAKALAKKYCFEIFAFAAVFLFSFMWAVSPRITLNGRVLLDIPLPYLVRGGLSIFRATGRFVWLPCLMFMTAALGLVSRLNPQTAIIAIALCFAVQGLDMRDWCQDIHSEYNNDSVTRAALSRSEWNEVTDGAEEIIFLPLPPNYAAYMQLYFDFAQLALRKDMNLSSFYLARSDYGQISAYAQEQYDMLCSGKGRKEAIYVFFDESEVPQDVDNIKVYNIDGYTVAKVK